VSVTLEVIDPPTVDRLYFWALQADFADASGRAAGGAHFGLQWHPDHPGGTAVNWGGYDRSGSILRGSESALPSALHNDNTRDLSWSPRRPYRLRISRSTDPAPVDGLVGWHGSITDLTTSTTIGIRDLYVAADRISGAVMWSEVFARCDDPSSAVRWADPTAVDLTGMERRPVSVSTNYQSHAEGGCANTCSIPDEAGIVQRTACDRVTPQGVRLEVPDYRARRDGYDQR